MLSDLEVKCQKPRDNFNRQFKNASQDYNFKLLTMAIKYCVFRVVPENI
jgi:hypothetical protein